MFEKYEIFISYKSHDVQLARFIADQLIASGKRVWFAEYQILLRRYSKFQKALDAGLRKSDYGLAITNDRYASSTYCQHEMKELLSRCPGRVLEVRVPQEEKPHQLFPALATNPHYIGGDITGILKFISDHTGWTLDTTGLSEASDPPQITQAVCMDWAYTLDLTNWTVTKPGDQRMADWFSSEWREPFGRTGLNVAIGAGRVPLSYDGPEARNNDSRFRFFMNLHAGPEFSSTAQRHAPNSDDREMYRELMSYLPRHFRRLWFTRLTFAKLRGLHLFFHGGFSQFVVTYKWADYWTRKYSVILRHPKAYVPAEFVFTFGFNGPFEEYCRRVHLMDRLVSSLRWATEGRYITYLCLRDNKLNLSLPRVIGIYSNREDAQRLRDAQQKQSTQDVFVYAQSESAFLSRYGQAGKEKIAEFEQQSANESRSR